MIDLPRLRRPLQSASSSLLPPNGPELAALEHSSDPAAWSAEDELEALETVWESLCHDAQAGRPSVQLPQFSYFHLAAVSVPHPPRRPGRRIDEPGLLAS